jgi:hypothetical protein
VAVVASHLVEATEEATEAAVVVASPRTDCDIKKTQEFTWAFGHGMIEVTSTKGIVARDIFKLVFAIIGHACLFAW